MEMPRPTEQHQRLALLAGTWVGDETIHPSRWDPRGGKATSKVVARVALGGFHLISDYEQERDGRMSFAGHGVYGWDPRGRCYTMHWFDSSGIEHGAPAIGTWEGSTLSLQHELTHFGFSRYVWEMLGDGAYRYAIQNSPDGKEWTTFLTGAYRRT